MWIQLVLGRCCILIIRLQGFQWNSCFPQKLYVFYSFNKQLLLSQLRTQRDWCLNGGLQFLRTGLSAEGATQARTEAPVVNKPCRMQPQQEGLVHILYSVPSSPQSLGLLSFIRTSEPVLSVSPTLILSMKAQP